MEVLNKSHFSLQMGNCPITIAEHSGLRWSQVYQKYIYLYFWKFDLNNFDKVELDCEIDGF